MPCCGGPDSGNMNSPTAMSTSDYAQEDISSRVIISASIFIVLESGAVALRCAARLNYQAQWGTDDLLMVPALLFNLAVCVVSISE